MSKKIQKILAATSLSETSDHVVETGWRLAKATGAEFYLLHAYAMPALYYGSPMGMATVHPYALEGERDELEKRLDAQLQRVEVPWADVAGKVIEVGSPHRLLTSASQELDVDLLMVGASESHGPFAPLLGSTADRVLRRSHVPVWVARGVPRLPLSRVLAPVDLSELSHESLRRGLEILEAFEGERPTLEVLFVLSAVEKAGSVQFTPEQVDRFAHEELERVATRLGADTGWHATPELRTGLPRQEVVAELDKSPADLVILGTHGRSGFERLLMGSVAADVVRYAKSSVLVVPPRAAHDAMMEERVAEAATVG